MALMQLPLGVNFALADTYFVSPNVLSSVSMHHLDVGIMTSQLSLIAFGSADFFSIRRSSPLLNKSLAP
ncbi:unnamed protein product [Toxocara canis]|uniref:Secreted protein n=1 Tax=Toxocara canis TaxID=6265 RepID=A0A183U740_TOXCA|nr:unnamed protein product [Toxocara canis]